MGIGRTPTFSSAALPLIVRSDTMPKNRRLRFISETTVVGYNPHIRNMICFMMLNYMFYT